VRYVSAIFLFAGLATALSCSRLATKGVVVDSSFQPFIPPDTKVLASAQIAKLEATPLYNSHKEQFNLAQLQAFSERTGLDPTRDLSEILFAWDGKQSLLMARGHFSPSKVGPKLESLGARRRSYKNYTLFGDDRNSLLFIRDGFAIAGAYQSLRDLIDGRDKSHRGIPGELQQRLEVIPKADQIWAVSRGGLPVSGIPMRSEVDSALSNISGIVSSTAMGIGIDTGIHLEADLTCVSEQAAQRVRDALRGGIGLARLTTKDNQLGLLRLYDSVHVDQENSVIHVRSDLPPDLANQLLSYIPQVTNRAGRIFETLP
jgi:ribosomal protein S13